MALNIKGNILSSSDVTSVGVFKSKIIRDNINSYLDAGNQNSYTSPSIASTWNDYGSSSAYYIVLSSVSVILKNTSTSWVGNFQATISVSGYYTVSFNYSATENSTLVMDNDGIMDNTYNVTLSPTTTTQTHSYTVNVTTTGSILFYFRTAGGGNITVSNFRYYKTYGWYDISGGGNEATISEFSYVTTGGGSLENTTIRNGSYGIVYPLTNFPKLIGSLEIWARPTSWSDSNGLFVNRDDTTANASDWFWLGIYGAGSTLYFRLGNATGCCGNDNSIPSWSTYHALNTWGLYTVTWSNGYYSRVYFNGKLLTTVGISGVPNTNPTATGRIGLGHASTNAMWLGQIATYILYNRELNPYEIAENFQATRGRFGI